MNSKLRPYHIRWNWPLKIDRVKVDNLKFHLKKELDQKSVWAPRTSLRKLGGRGAKRGLRGSKPPGDFKSTPLSYGKKKATPQKILAKVLCNIWRFFFMFIEEKQYFLYYFSNVFALTDFYLQKIYKTWVLPYELTRNNIIFSYCLNIF